LARDLLAALERRVLLVDGAMGTMLMASGVKARCPEEINLISPQSVQAVHAAYVEAGADVIETNSFGGSRPKMARSGAEEIVVEANQAAARIAREVAGDSVLVAGSIGPMGEFLEPVGPITYDRAVDIFWEQASALSEGGVDFFVVETMYDLNEARAAIQAAARTGLPVVCTMTFEPHGRTMMGVSPAAAVAEIRSAGAVVVGANCSVGPDQMLKTVESMHREDPSAWLMAQPNAGVPVVKGGRTVYSASPEGMAEYASRFLEMGVRMVGSCCGSSPEYTRAIARVVKGA
jgi:5-methyltetrahydrofolate--homocysteine methyltransferase